MASTAAIGSNLHAMTTQSHPCRTQSRTCVTNDKQAGGGKGSGGMDGLRFHGSRARMMRERPKITIIERAIYNLGSKTRRDR